MILTQKSHNMKERTFTTSGDTPSKKNSRRLFVRGGKPVSIPGKRHQEWHRAATWELISQKVKQSAVPAIDPVTVKITLFSKTRRAYDLDNKAASVLDALVDAAILQTDSIKHIDNLFISHGGVDKENPRAEIVIISKK